MTYRNDRFDQSPQHPSHRLHQFGPVQSGLKPTTIIPLRRLIALALICGALWAGILLLAGV